MNREEYQRLWEARLTDLDESGLTQQQWCEQNGVSYSTLKYWVLKANKEKNPQRQNTGSEWLSLKVSSLPGETYTNASKSGKISVNFGGFKVDINNSADPGQIFNILRMLKEL
jgi:hypothetical protein